MPALPSPSSRRAPAHRRGSPLLLLLLTLSACGAAPAAPAPAPSAVHAEPPSATTPEPSAAPSALPSARASAAPRPAPETIIIHRSEIYGSVVSRRGKVVELLSLLMTSETPPAPGTKALLFRKATKKESGEWIQLGEVTLQKMAEGGKIEITLLDDPPSGKGDVYKKDLSVKIQIDR